MDLVSLSIVLIFVLFAILGCGVWIAIALGLIGLYVIVMIYGYAIDTEVKNVDTVILDQNRTPASRDFVNRLEATGLYTVVDYVASQDELHESIVAERAKVGVNIPADYQRNLNSGRHATIQVLIDGRETAPEAASKVAIAAIRSLIIELLPFLLT